MQRRFVTFGEIMLRLKSPGHERLFQSPRLEATFGGSEANVAVSLASFGLPVTFVTALPENDIADAAIRELRGLGVDTSAIVRGGARVGIYFLEAGANQRSSNVLYDRAGSSMAEARPEWFDWPSILDGARWFHVTGITPALSETAAQLSIDACRTARQLGVTVSCDLNYRAKLWRYGNSAPDVLSELFRHVDMGIANEEHCRAVLGVDSRAGSSGESGRFDVESCERLTARVLERYPNLSTIAVTLRESRGAGRSMWSACLRDAEGFKSAMHYELDDIVDRVGAGDAFAAGLIYGLERYRDRRRALEFAVAAGCIKHSIPGDFNRVSAAEVEKLMDGDASGRVQR